MSKCFIFSKIFLSVITGGISVLVIYFTGDSCGPDSCPGNKECQSVNGFDFQCVSQPSLCEGIPCCENGPNPLCCVNGGVCSNENYIFNGTNSDECQCICKNNFKGNLEFFVHKFRLSIIFQVLNVCKISVKTSFVRTVSVMPENVSVKMVLSISKIIAKKHAI